jgi:hypothetical protein
MKMTRMVVSFNRHFFVLAIAACVVGITILLVGFNPVLRGVAALASCVAVYFMISSVIASYVTYDASDLYKLEWWPRRTFSRVPGEAVLVNAGFDPASPVIRAKYPQTQLRVLNFFNEHRTTEASIQRAHRLSVPAAAEEKIASDAWPVASASQDVVFALSAAHELRKAEERVAFFQEAKRVLKRDGRIIVIEQLRDWINFACFGIAAFHFLGRTTWLRSFAAAGLTVRDEFKISPFLRAFVLQ